MFIWTLGEVVVYLLICFLIDFFEDRKKRKKDKEGE